MKNLKRSDIIAVILCLCTIIPGVLVYDRLPERVVTSWSMTSKSNDTASKAFAVFGIPLIFTGVTFLNCIYLRWLEKKRNIGKLIPVIMIFPMILFLCQGVILLSALGKIKDIRLIVCLVISVIMIFLGNYMPKIRKNWVIGIRTPHIISSDEIWDKTHRFGGFVLIISGITAFILSLLGYFIAAFVILIVSVFIPMVYGEAMYYSSKRKQ